jgi:hypothetical protein
MTGMVNERGAIEGAIEGAIAAICIFLHYTTSEVPLELESSFMLHHAGYPCMSGSYDKDFGDRR